MKVDETILKDWITDIRNSEIALPRFQRFEEWEKRIKERFLTSIVRDLPAGVTLIWNFRGDPPFEYRYLEGAPEKEDGHPDKLLLDGQQRLTTVWRALNNLYENRTYLLDLEDEKSSVISVKRYEKNGRDDLYPLWVDNPKECWERNKVPLHLLNPDKNTTRINKWCEEAVDNKEKREDLTNKLYEIRDTISTFKLPRLGLGKKANCNEAIDVFIKLNTSYVSLSTFDKVVARTEANTGESLHKMKKDLLDECPEISDYRDPEKYVLNVVTLLQDLRPTKKNKEENLNFQRLVDEWEEVISGTNDLISFLEQESIYDGKRLPTHVVLAPLAVLLAKMPSHPDERGNVKRLLRKYFWRASFTDRYERTTSKRIFNDFQALRKRINGEEREVPCFDEDDHPLPTEEELKQAGWPKKKNRLGRAILALTLKKGARNFADDDEVTKRNIKDREYHHLYPKDFLEKEGIDGEDADIALNCAFIRWEDNRTISGKKPLEYLLERSQADELGEDQIRRRLESHIVNYDSMVENDYENFLDERASDLAEKIKSICQGKEIS